MNWDVIEMRQSLTSESHKPAGFKALDRPILEFLLWLRRMFGIGINLAGLWRLEPKYHYGFEKQLFDPWTLDSYKH